MLFGNRVLMAGLLGLQMASSAFLDHVHCRAEGCTAFFKSDGHEWCVSHTPCSAGDCLFDPAACSRWVTFLLCLPAITETEQQWLNIGSRWKALRKL